MALLASALALWALDASSRWRILESADSYGSTTRPAADPASPTGFEFGQRTRLQLSADSYHWTMQAQQAAAEGEWRVRRVAYDNAPWGREVHWSSPLRGWIGLVARIDATVTGRPLPQAIEYASLYAGPWLLAVLAVGLTPVVARRFGPAAAAVFGVGMVGVAPVSSAFAIGTIDHHGIAVVAGLCSALGLAAAPGAAAPSKWMIFSAVAGGLGLWISAATQVPVLIGLGLGAIAGAWVTRMEAPALAPALWRVWGIAGAATSMAAYVLEYFPGGFGWRLEVNHPLHALAWLGAGEILHRFARWLRGESFLGSGGERGIIAAAFGAFAILPGAILLAGERAFRVSDPLLWMLHADYIEEFGPLVEEFVRPGGLPKWAVLLLVVTVLPLLLAPAIFWASRRDTSPSARSALWLMTLPALLALGMTLAQKRWLHLGGALGLGLLVLVASQLRTGGIAWLSPRRRRALGWSFAGLVLLPFPIAVMRQALALQAEGPQVGPAEMRELGARDVARWLRQRAGTDSVAVLSDPTTTTQLVYFGGFRGVGTLYWENLEGIRTTMQVAGAASPAEAESLIRQRGITHVVAFSWQPLAEKAARLVRGLRAKEPPPRGTFLQEVQEGKLPTWLRPLPYRLPGHPYFADKYVAVFEVAFGQSAAEAVTHQARYLLANGDVARAVRLLEEVRAGAPDHLPALCTLAQIHLGRRDAARLDEVWSRIMERVARGAKIEPDDRIVIVQCLLAAGRRAEAREQLRVFWASTEERSLRRLPAGGLDRAYRLANELEVTLPSGAAEIAERLVRSGSAR